MVRTKKDRMNAPDLLKAFAAARKRTHFVGSLKAGVIVALDMEGRLFVVLDGEVLNRVNPDAIAAVSSEVYLNPGGDGLWPAPEGTTLGYQYSTGRWRVAPGVRGARYLVTRAGGRSTEVIAEVDLINSRGLGIPTQFKRSIAVIPGRRSVTVRVVESITYLGHALLRRSDCLLAPWSLCQFDSGPGCEVVFPSAGKSDVWDLYDDASDVQRQWDGSLCHTATNGSQRYQIGIGRKVPWIEFRDPQRGLCVRRSADPLPVNHSYIDIRDAAPHVPPSRKGVRYSVYSDTARFMEIEAAGGCAATIPPNLELRVVVSTRYSRVSPG